MFETRRKRTIIVVKITGYGEITRSYDYYLTDSEWNNKKTSYDMKEKHYTWINSDTILFIRKEKS